MFLLKWYVWDSRYFSSSVDSHWCVKTTDSCHAHQPGTEHRLIRKHTGMFRIHIEMDITHCVVVVIGLRLRIQVSSYNIRSDPHLIFAVILLLLLYFFWCCWLMILLLLGQGSNWCDQSFGLPLRPVHIHSSLGTEFSCLYRRIVSLCNPYT